MDLILAESLIAVADTGAISSAAQSVHISQSALSRRLQQLESELGAQLLVRGRNGAELTEAGRLATTECRTLLARYEAMRRDIAEHLGLRRGTVVLGGGATAASALLPRAIASFRAEHPQIRFEVREAGSRQVVDDVVAGRVQIGVVTLPVEQEEVDVSPLLIDRVALVARADESLRRTTDPRRLNGRGLIAFEAGSAIRRIVDSALMAAGVEMEVTMQLRSVPSMLQMVVATGDVAFVSTLAAAGHEGVRAIELRDLPISRPLALATRRAVPLPPAAAEFLQHLRSTEGSR